MYLKKKSLFNKTRSNFLITQNDLPQKNLCHRLIWALSHVSGGSNIRKNPEFLNSMRWNWRCYKRVSLPIGATWRNTPMGQATQRQTRFDIICAWKISMKHKASPRLYNRHSLQHLRKNIASTHLILIYMKSYDDDEIYQSKNYIKRSTRIFKDLGVFQRNILWKWYHEFKC